MTLAKVLHPSSASTADRRSRALPTLAGDYLGPGIVSARDGTGVLVTLSSGVESRAEMALPLPYEPREGDVLLVIGRAEALYVIGVLAGAGRTDLAFQGDVTLRAVGGAVDIVGDQGVRVSGPRLELHTTALRVFAETVVETVSTLVQRVTETLTVYAKSSNTVVEEGIYTQAKTAAIRTEETMSINGKQIHLG